MFAVDLARFQETLLQRDPFDYLVVPDFIKVAALPALRTAFPVIAEPGCYPVRRFHYGSAFADLLEELTGPEVRAAFEAKFGIELNRLPTVVTVRGCCGARDGRIHTDLPGKVITVLLYLNTSWDSEAGRLRLLRSPNDLDAVITEVPPVEGTLLAFRRSDNSFHGHRPYVGERRVLQMNWVTRRHLWALRHDELKERFTTVLRRWLPGK